MSLTSLKLTCCYQNWKPVRVTWDTKSLAKIFKKFQLRRNKSAIDLANTSFREWLSST